VSLLGDALDYVRANPDRFWEAVQVHLRISLTALALAIAIFFPLGVIVSRTGRVGAGIVAAVAAARVVPSLAVLFLLYPILGLGEKPAVVALVLLAGPSIVINTDAGLRGVAPIILENARGLGMNPFQIFARVQLPLASPVVVAGIRSATVEVIASATLAAFIGAGGLGGYITAGLTLLDFRLLLVGGIPVTIMALLAEGSLGALERRLTPPVA
jgi:osmoprotectant transport system permease protein